jgi:hypothetical protein
MACARSRGSQEAKFRRLICKGRTKRLNVWMPSSDQPLGFRNFPAAARDLLLPPCSAGKRSAKEGETPMGPCLYRKKNGVGGSGYGGVSECYSQQYRKGLQL